MNTDFGKLGKYIIAKADKREISCLAVKEVDSRFSWVMDGPKVVALLDKQKCWLDLWRGVAEDLPDPQVPQYYHAPTKMGARISLTWWKESAPGHTFSTSKRMQIQTIDDGSLALYFEEHYKDGSGWKCAHIFYSHEYGRYIVDLTGEIQGLPLGDGHRVEFVNVYPFGIFDDRIEKKRYQRTYFAGTECGKVCYAHNPLIPYLNTRRSDLLKTVSEPYEELFYIGPGDYFGFGIESGFNPFIVIAEDSMDFERATCCNLQDEHFFLRDDCYRSLRSGMCHVSLTYLWAEEVKKLDADSHFLTFKKYCPQLPCFPSDADGIVRAIDPAKTRMCAFWLAGEPFSKVMRFVPESGPTGKGEIVVDGLAYDAQVIIKPVGTSFHLTEGKKHTIKCSIKVDDENVFAKVWVLQFLYSADNRRSPMVESKTITSNDRWNPVSLEFYPAPDSCFWGFYLQVTGAGTVHVSDFDYIVE